MSTKNSQKPVYEIRVGQIKGSVWTKETKGKGGFTQISYSCKIVKSFKEDGGDWKETNFFFPDDLPKLTLVSQKCFEFIAIKTEEKA